MKKNGKILYPLLTSVSKKLNSNPLFSMLDDAMLKTKKFKEFMEPLDKRIADVERFLRIFKRGLVYDVCISQLLPQKKRKKK